MKLKCPRPAGAPLPGSKEWPEYLRRTIEGAFAKFNIDNEKEKRHEE